MEEKAEEEEETEGEEKGEEVAEEDSRVEVGIVASKALNIIPRTTLQTNRLDKGDLSIIPRTIPINRADKGDLNIIPRTTQINRLSKGDLGTSTIWVVAAYLDTKALATIPKVADVGSKLEVAELQATRKIMEGGKLRATTATDASAHWTISTE